MHSMCCVFLKGVTQKTLILLNTENKISTVMANNPTDINKANNYLSPQINKHKQTTTDNVEYQVPSLRHAQLFMGLSG